MKLLEPTQIKIALEPVIFLAGPATGTYDWQNIAISHFKKLETKYDISDFIIANPRTYTNSDQFDLAKQVAWENNYLTDASVNGCIMFWLAKETIHNRNRTYARTTRFELGEWLNEFKNDDSINIRIGIEDGFDGAEYIIEKLNIFGYNNIIHHDLINLCVDVFESINF